MHISEVFHEGERFVQERTGERASALLNAGNLGTAIQSAARQFVGQQVWCAISAKDVHGRIWSSLLVGEKGFLLPDQDMCGITVCPTDFPAGDASPHPLSELHLGHSVGMLLIELTTRRRLRINGVLTRIDETGFHLAVEESFPACPKYIQRRKLDLGGTAGRGAPNPSAFTDRRSVCQLLKEADTLFLGTTGPNGRMDVSHRGGRPGFASFRDGTIWLPDFSGNSMFNTLGNLHLDPHCGLVVPDFLNGRQYQLSGHAKIHFDVPDEIAQTGGTMRWIEFQADDDGFASAALPIRWVFVDASPFNP